MLANRKQDRIIRRLMIFLTVFCLCFGLTPVSTEAESAASVISNKLDGEDLLIYYSGADGQQVSLQIGNTLIDSEALSDSLMTDTGLPIHTVLLLDNSISLKRIWEKNAKKLMAEMIDGHASGEVFKLATYAEGLSVISDFTDDYEGLKASIDEIKYVNQDSYLTDILYDMVNEFKTSGEAYFTRIVVICDGSDHNEITYTNAELTKLLGESGIPVHSVGAATSNNSNSKELELLFSYSRASGGKYVMVTNSSDTTEAKAMLDEDYSIRCLKASLPFSLKDGSVKAAKLTVSNGTEEKVITANLTMPFGVAPEPEIFKVSFADETGSTILYTYEIKEGEVPVFAGDTPVKAEDDKYKYTFNGWTDGSRNYALMDTLPPVSADTVYKAVFTSQEKPAPKPTELVTVPVEPEAPEFPIVGLIALVVILAMIIAAIVLLIMKFRKPKEEPQYIQSPAEREPERAHSSSGSSATVMLGNTVMIDDSDKTRPISQTVLILEDVDDPSNSHRADFNSGRVRIGRAQSSDIDISLSFDKTVSGTHCEIMEDGDRFVLRHLGMSNPTVLNGSIYVRNGETPVQVSTGDQLTIGSRTYRITISYGY